MRTLSSIVETWGPRKQTWRSRRTLLSFLTVALVGMSSLLGAARFEDFEKCKLPSLGPGGVGELEARCLNLAVPFDGQDSAGATFDLSVKIVPAIDRDVKADPLFFLAGGPGQAASETWGILGLALASVNKQRDIILVDQRGTGDSHPLRCEPADDLKVETLEETLELVRTCQTQLNLDLSFFLTEQAVADLERVRTHLGYEQVNVLGVSYGTRVAQRWAAAHPSSIRTMILDGVVPLDFSVGEAISVDAERALDGLIERCESESRCAEAFPDLKARYLAFLADLKANPRSLTVEDPTSGEPSDIVVDHTDFAQVVRLLTYSPETSSLLPLLIEDAIGGRPEKLMVQGAMGGALDSIYDGMFYSVLCAEDAPFIDLDRVLEEAKDTYLAGEAAKIFAAICQEWTSGQMESEYREPLISDIPTLLFSGENDPVTPPAYGERVSSGLSSSLHLVAPTMGHNVVVRGCAPQLVQQFLDDGTPTHLDGSCMDDIRAMPFFINRSGPTP